jgi:hypothetical protein
MNDRGVVTLSGSGEVLAPDRLPAAPWAPWSQVNSDVSEGLESPAAQEIHRAWKELQRCESRLADTLREYATLDTRFRELGAQVKEGIDAEAAGTGSREGWEAAQIERDKMQAAADPDVRKRREGTAERAVTDAAHNLEQLVNEHARELLGEMLPLMEKVSADYQKKHEKFLGEVESTQREWWRMRDAAMQILGRTKPIRAEDFPADGEYGTPPVPANLVALLNPEEVAA